MSKVGTLGLDLGFGAHGGTSIRSAQSLCRFCNLTTAIELLRVCTARLLFRPRTLIAGIDGASEDGEAAGC
jgi:hypothetical protein